MNSFLREKKFARVRVRVGLGERGKNQLVLGLLLCAAQPAMRSMALG